MRGIEHEDIGTGSGEVIGNACAENAGADDDGTHRGSLRVAGLVPTPNHRELRSARLPLSLGTEAPCVQAQAKLLSITRPLELVLHFSVRPDDTLPLIK